MYGGKLDCGTWGKVIESRSLEVGGVLRVDGL